MKPSKILKVRDYLLNLQQTIYNWLTFNDNFKIKNLDNWENKNNYGRTWVVERGKIFEKAAINFSYVQGDTLPPAALDKINKNNKLTNQPFEATGLSLIFHPDNPFIPTVHFNLRFFSLKNKNNNKNNNFWFGGGCDLTPYYGFENDCIHWHRSLKNICENNNKNIYNYHLFKKNCDNYFYLKHRQERRGIGGIFFDQLANNWESDFKFIKNLGDSFLLCYSPIVERRIDYKFNKIQKDFQNYRRGRYVEFNLIYDRGTQFGLQFGGRTESILASLPPLARWTYNFQPAAKSNSRELELYQKFLIIKDWV